MRRPRGRGLPSPMDSPPPARPASPASPVAFAIRSLGTHAFPAAFARIVGSDFRADQVVVFRFDGSGRIRSKRSTVAS